MTKYRPEGWDRKVDEITSRILDIEGHDGDPSLVESGADAMLEALTVGTGIYCIQDGLTFIITPGFDYTQWKRGRLIFIPDDKEG